MRVLKLSIVGLVLSIGLWSNSVLSAERTLSMIKPDAVSQNLVGKIYTRFEEAGLKIVAAKMYHLTKTEAEAFYAVHKTKPFYQPLVDFMCSGPIMVQVLEGDNAVSKHREMMGATNPKEAKPGTIRADFATSLQKNAVHGSDSLENANKEIDFFFSDLEMHSR